MSQAVANVKQFAQSIKTKPISGVIGGMPAGLGQSAKKLREEKKKYKKELPGKLQAEKDREDLWNMQQKGRRGDTVTGNGPYDSEVIDPGKERVNTPNQDIYDAEIIEDPKALTTGPRMITSERIHAPKAIEPSRQWSNG